MTLITITLAQGDDIATMSCSLATFLWANPRKLSDGELGALRSRVAKGQAWHHEDAKGVRITIAPATRRDLK
jgi:hypothetical protein